jgi:hypothetical protein
MFPGGTIWTGMCRYGLGPASTVDPHPSMSAHSVGWYYGQKLLGNLTNENCQTNRGLRDFAELWHSIQSVFLLLAIRSAFVKFGDKITCLKMSRSFFENWLPFASDWRPEILQDGFVFRNSITGTPA